MNCGALQSRPSVGWARSESGKLDAGGANNSSKGQASLPTGATAALDGSTGATIQLVTSDGFCVSATLDDVQDKDIARFRARKQ